MDKLFKFAFHGYEIHAGAQLLENGRYAPTLLVRRENGDRREEYLLPVPGAGAFLTPEEAELQAFNHGMNWVKDHC